MFFEADRRVIDAFVLESQEMLCQVLPFVEALARQPDREDLFDQVTGSCFRLFHSVKGTGSFLCFDHLTAPAEAIEYLLDRVRSGILALTPERIGLLAEACLFLKDGLTVVHAQRDDASLADSAAVLTAAIQRSASRTDEGNARVGDAELPLEMRESFFWETETLLAAAEQEFVLWDYIAVDLERVRELSRLLLRLKQSFILYEFFEPERICTALESSLKRYVNGEFFQTEYPERVFLHSIDAIRTSINQFSFFGELTVPDLDQHLAALQGLMRQPIGELLIEAGLVDPSTIDQALELQRTTREEQPRRLGEVLIDMGEVTEAQLQQVLQDQHKMRSRNEQVQSKLAAQATPFRPLTVSTSHEICIDGRRLEQMGAVLAQLIAMRLPGEHQQLLGELRGLIQSCRRDAFAALAGQMQRMVHDLAVGHGKRVHLTIEGIEHLQEMGDVALLAEAIPHLLRNGVEHGVEAPEERQQANKNKTGKLRLFALCKDDEFWVSVEDDGRGIDFARVAKVLVDRGLVSTEHAAQLSKRERLQLLFKSPGTTSGSRENTTVSGLAMVNASLQGVKGKIEVATKAGKGTFVTLRVPR